MSYVFGLGFAGAMSVLAQAATAPSFAIPEVAGLVASASVVAVLIYLLRTEKMEKAEQRREFLEALRANTASIDRLADRVDDYAANRRTYAKKG